MEVFIIVFVLFGISLVIIQHGLAQELDEPEDDGDRFEFRW